MALNWFYKAKEEEIGPISSSELKEKAEKGAVMLTTPVRREGDENWSEACLVKGLFPPAIAEAAAKAAKARAAAAEAAPEPEEEEEVEAVVEEEVDEADLLPEEKEPVTLPPLEPEPQAGGEAGEATEEASAEKPAKAGRKLSPLLLAAVGGGVALVLVVGLVVFFFMGGEEEPEPQVANNPPAISQAEQNLNTVSIHIENEKYDEAAELLASTQEMVLNGGEQARAESLAAELAEGRDMQAATQTLEQIERELGQRNAEAALASIAVYQGNPQANEEEKTRLAALEAELLRATSVETAQAAVAELSDEELQAIEQRQWEPAEPYENENIGNMAVSTMAAAARDERTRRQQALEEAAAAEAQAKRLSREEYLAFRHQYDDFMRRIAALRIGDPEGEPTAQRWTFLENFPKVVGDNLEYSQSFAGRKQILSIAAACEDYLLDRAETVAAKQRAIETLQSDVTAAAEEYPEDSLARQVFGQLAEALGTQLGVYASEAETLQAARAETQFEYALADRHDAPEFVDQLTAGMLGLRANLTTLRAPQKTLKFDVWPATQHDYPAEWEEEYRAMFLAENVAAIEAYLQTQQASFENVAGLLGHWRRATGDDESLALDIYIQAVDLAVYEEPPPGDTWETAALLRTGASYLVLVKPEEGAVVSKPLPAEVAAMIPTGSEPTGFPYAYMVAGEEGQPHRLRALHLTAYRTVAPQGKLEGWCVFDERGRLYFLTGSSSRWSTPPVVTAFAATGEGDLRAANGATPAGLQLVEGKLAFGDSPGWSTTPGVPVLAGEYTRVGDDRPTWAAEFAAPLERPAEEHPFVSGSWRNDTEAVEVEEEEEAEASAASE